MVTELIGIDGCRGGWVVARSDRSLGNIRFLVVENLEDILDLAREGKAIVVIDVPIGLPQPGPRDCDIAARAFLGQPRRSSVFPAPCRPTLAAECYEQACQLNFHACGRRISKQLWGILPKIREVDSLITPGLQRWVREAHPEVTFGVLSGRGKGLCHGKRTPAGEAERLKVLQRHGIRFNVDTTRQELGRSLVAGDDIVDAAACLATAHRISSGKTRMFPQNPTQQDSRGLLAEIVA